MSQQTNSPPEGGDVGIASPFPGCAFHVWKFRQSL